MADQANLFPGPRAEVQPKDEVFKVTLMDSEGCDPLNRYLVVETVDGKILVCGKVFGAPKWFTPSSFEAIPGFTDREDPVKGTNSLVVRWTLVPDRNLSITELTDRAFRVPHEAFEAARDHGRAFGFGMNSAGEDELPDADLDRIFSPKEPLPALTWEDLEAVDGQYRCFGARCRIIKNVLSREQCEFFKAFMNNSEKLDENGFQGLGSKFWLSLRVKSTTDKLADLIFRRMEPAVRDLVIQVDDDDSGQRLVVVGADPAASDQRCPEALQIGAGGEWTPYGFNPTVRFAKYTPGGQFCKHIDAMYKGSFYFWTPQGVDRCGELKVKDPPKAEARVSVAQLRRWRGGPAKDRIDVDEKVREGLLREVPARTLFSCLFYLHDSTSGATNFLRIPARFSDFMEITTPANAPVSLGSSELLASVRPEAGSAVLFFQPGLTHDGAAVTEGDEKYFFRTDLVFLRKDDLPRSP